MKIFLLSIVIFLFASPFDIGISHSSATFTSKCRYGYGGQYCCKGIGVGYCEPTHYGHHGHHGHYGHYGYDYYDYYGYYGYYGKR
ncbi:hypothetical protein Anas_07649 [Armadillidium nasatum]|uniref:Uncharacterized protein n=1 Tax=Armadillidium nasatum TaxID=96803 RepID=A0A5N5SQF8_9CRUS|nr:hypothetical protein Anas_07649 [Armadillidium nasatum]